MERLYLTCLPTHHTSLLQAFQRTWWWSSASPALSPAFQKKLMGKPWLPKSPYISLTSFWKDSTGEATPQPNWGPTLHISLTSFTKDSALPFSKDTRGEALSHLPPSPRTLFKGLQLPKPPYILLTSVAKKSTGEAMPPLAPYTYVTTYKLYKGFCLSHFKGLMGRLCLHFDSPTMNRYQVIRPLACCAEVPCKGLCFAPPLSISLLIRLFYFMQRHRVNFSK